MKTAPNPITDTSRTQPSTAPSMPETPSSASTEPQELPSGSRIGFGTLTVAGGAIAAVAIAVAVALGPSATSTSEQAPPAQQGEDAALDRLVRLGYVPSEALEPAVTEETLTRGLQAKGLVPTGPAEPTASSLSRAAEERSLTRSLVDRGLVPAEALQPTTEHGHTQYLIVRGLVPQGS